MRTDFKPLRHHDVTKVTAINTHQYNLCIVQGLNSVSGAVQIAYLIKTVLDMTGWHFTLSICSDGLKIALSFTVIRGLNCVRFQ